MRKQPEKSFFSQELRLRIVSGVLLAALALVATWIGGQTYVLLWAVISLLVFLEFSRISAASMPLFARFSALAFLALVLICHAMGYDRQAYLIMAVGFLAVLALELVAARTFWAATGLLYAAMPFIAFCHLREETEEGLVITLVVFAIVWGADVLAYFAGRLIGGPKLAPVISPNKTWAGFFGGLTGSIVLAGLVAAGLAGSVSVLFWGLVFCTSIVSQLGDLAESYVKRRFDVKDSGSIIPGHGGVLDRIDGLIFAGVFVWGVLILVSLQEGMPKTLPAVFSAFFLSP